MATVSFVLKSKKNPASIYARFRNGRSMDLFSLVPYKVNPSHWSKNKQRLKNTVDGEDKDIINQQLHTLEGFILRQFNLVQGTDEVIDKTWLDNVIAKHFNKTNTTKEDEIYFTAFIDRYIKEDAPNKIAKGKGKKLTPGTIKRYNYVYGKLLKFEQHRRKRLRFTDLNLKFKNDLLKFLDKEENIKTFARAAKAEGIEINPQIDHPDFYVPTQETVDTYLNEEEINKIFFHDFNDNSRLDNVRDLFIIGLRTGLRISDFLSIKEIKGDYLTIKTKKTNKEVVIPVHVQIKDILDKRGGNMPRSISDQKFNQYVKDVCKEVGITEEIEGAMVNPETKRKEKGIYEKYKLISSHTCRRSFASNLYGKINNPTIMAITGHKTERQFLEYIKITPKENAEMLKAFWEGEVTSKKDQLKAV